MAQRFRWELVETRRDGTKVCAHDRPVEYDDRQRVTVHSDDRTKCVGTE